MRRFLLLLLLLAAPLAAEEPAGPPGGWKVGAGMAFEGGPRGTLVLTARADRAVRTAFPDFRLWKLSEYDPELLEVYPYAERQAPFAVLGDFNGDKVLDAALSGRSQKEALLLVALSGAKGYQALALERIPWSKDLLYRGETGGKPVWGLGWSLELQPPGRLELPIQGLTLQLEHEAVIKDLFQKGSVYYYYRDGKFHEQYGGC